MKNWLKKLFRSNLPSTSVRPPESLDDVLRTSGKACSVTLLELAHTVSAEDFSQIIHCPSLVGSGILDGDIVAPAHAPRSSATFEFKPSEVAAFVNGMPLENSIFLLRKETGAWRTGEYTSFTLGRAPDNDIRIVDFAISRYHARIVISADGFVISDLNSTNGTFLNGTKITDLPHTMVDGDTLSLARYNFRFLLPQSLFITLRDRVRHTHTPASP